MPLYQARNSSGGVLSSAIAAAGRPWCSSSRASKNSSKCMVDSGRPGVASASTTSSQAARAVVVPAQAVHGRRGVGAAGEVPGPRPPGPLPSLAELLGQRERLVPVAGQGGHDDQPGRGQVPLLAVERQVPDLFGQLPGGPQVAGGDGALGGHAERVGELKPGLGRRRAAGRASSVRRSALASAARISPRASWTAVSSSSAALSASGSPARRASAMARSASSAVTGSRSSPLKASAVSNRASAARSPSASARGLGRAAHRAWPAGGRVVIRPGARLTSRRPGRGPSPRRPGHPRGRPRRPRPAAAGARRRRSAGTWPRPRRQRSAAAACAGVRRELRGLLVPPLRLAGQAAGEAQLGQRDRQPVRLRLAPGAGRRPAQRGAQLVGQLIERRPPGAPGSGRRPESGARRPGTSRRWRARSLVSLARLGPAGRHRTGGSVSRAR